MPTLPPETKLLSRDDFRELALVRDGGRCVLCGDPATEVHHIIERRLFPDGGYFLSNALSVCNPCHLRCEMTEVSLEEAYVAAGIRTPALPPQAYSDCRYTKWLDEILPDGTRLPGPLFGDESVQKILRAGGMLHLYRPYIKYPRTFHLPWSPGVGKDDRVLSNTDAFRGKRAIVSEKLDGENCTAYSDGYVHARSLEYESHPSRDRVKALLATVAFELPTGWRVCGENVYARHAIAYDALPGYFCVFSIWNERNECLSWDETVEWASLLGLPTVPVLYDGVWDEVAVRKLWTPRREGHEMEGYVVRTADRFAYRDFSTHMGKYVRAGHVPEHGGHWKRKPVTPNKLRAEA